MLILVCGLPGSGKTTLAKELSRELKIVCLHKDSIKEELGNFFGCQSLPESKRLGECSMKILYRLASEQLRAGVSCILESPFTYEGDYTLFFSWQKEFTMPIYSVICELETEIREHRFMERERHSVHFDYTRNFSKSPFDYSKIPGKQIRLDMKKSVEELVRETSEFIRNN